MTLSPTLSVLALLGIFLWAGSVVAPSAHAAGVRMILMSQASDLAADPWAGVEEMVVSGGSGLAVGDFADADSVIAFDADDLASYGAQDISDLADFTPNLEIVNSGATTPTFFIRGVGLNDFNSNSTGAVAIYQDGVAINAPAMQLGLLYDVENVTVLRGPQAIGLHRNASAGAIKVRARRPSGSTGANISADFGDYNFRDFQGAIEAPIIEDVLSVRVAGRFAHRDGTLKNRCANAPPFGSRIPYVAANGGDSRRGLGPWSICAEADPFRGDGSFSDIPVGLAKKVNDQNNWAGRVTFLFKPDTEIPTTWTFNVHGGRRDELTRLGQSSGAGGFYCLGGDICSAPLLGTPPSQQGVNLSRTLGGPQNRTGNGYRTPENIRRLGELSPCSVERQSSGRLNTCSTFEPGESIADVLRDRSNENKAKIVVARELARELDSQPWEGDYNRTGRTTNTVLGGFLTGEFDWTSEIQMSTTTGFDSYDREIENDADFSPETLFHIDTIDDGHQVYQDLKFEGTHEDLDNPIGWEISGWFLFEELNVEVINDLGRDAGTGVGSRAYRQTGWSYGVSGSASIEFLEDFTLDGGVRFNWDRKDLDYILFPGAGLNEFTNLDETWEEFTGTVRLTYRLRENISIFGKYTRGWKPGTYNATSGQFRPVTIADPEEIDSYEAGIDASFFEDILQLRSQFFYYAYADYQIFTTQQRLGGNTEFVTLNAKDAEVYGAEVELAIVPWEYTRVDLLVSWLETQFLDFVQTDQGLSNSGIFIQQRQNSGNSLLNSPRFKIILQAEQGVPLGRFGSLRARYDGVWTDDAFFDASEGLGTPNILGQQFFPEYTVGQAAYWLHNIRVTWKNADETIEVAGWMRNITNHAYKQFAFDASSFQNTTVQFVGDPRTMGLSVNFKF